MAAAHLRREDLQRIEESLHWSEKHIRQSLDSIGLDPDGFHRSRVSESVNELRSTRARVTEILRRRSA